MSPDVFFSKYPSGKVPRQYQDFGKTFVCRRGCNTRTATYTDEFVWEEVYNDGQDIFGLIDMVEKGTKATRRRRARSQSPHDVAYHPPTTPTKTARSAATTPQSRRSAAEPGSRSKRFVITPRGRVLAVSAERISGTRSSSSRRLPLESSRRAMSSHPLSR